MPRSRTPQHDPGSKHVLSLGRRKVEDFGVDFAEDDVEEAGDHVGALLCPPVVIALDDVVLVEEKLGRNRSLKHDVPLEGNVSIKYSHLKGWN